MKRVLSGDVIRDVLFEAFSKARSHPAVGPIADQYADPDMAIWEMFIVQCQNEIDDLAKVERRGRDQKRRIATAQWVEMLRRGKVAKARTKK